MTAKKPRPISVHAKCCKVRITQDRTLVCGKSKGHAGAEHYDPSADERWSTK